MIPERGRSSSSVVAWALALACLACLACAPASAAEQGEAPPDTLEVGESAAARTLPDSVAAQDARPRAWRRDTPFLRAAVDGRSVVGPGTARRVGSGWAGHREALARDALPAALSTVSLDGRRSDDWISGGLFLLEAYALPSGAVVCESGPDVSLLWLPFDEAPPRLASGVLDAPPAVGLGLATSSAGFPPSRPKALVAMASGDLGLRETRFEFGRRALGGAAGIEAAYRRRDGRAPVSGGSHESESLAARGALALEGEWILELACRRTSRALRLPFEGSAPEALEVDELVSDLTATARAGATSVSIYHTQSRRTVGGRDGGGRTAESTVDGARLVLPVPYPIVDRLWVELSRASAGGDALAGPLHAVRAVAAVERRLALGGGRSLSLLVGADRARSATIPLAGAALALGSDLWLRADVGGRHPSAVELSARAAEIPSAHGGLAAAGADSLSPELALVLEAGGRRAWGALETGCAVSYARVADPVILVDRNGTLVPGNAPDATGATAAAWASIVGEGGTGASLSAAFSWIDDGEALAALAPTPETAVAAKAWRSASFFRDYLDVVLEVEVRHERGLARGRWDGTLDDAATELRATLRGEAGVARIELSADNLLDEAPVSLPGRPRPGRRITVGFSWVFWD